MSITTLILAQKLLQVIEMKSSRHSLALLDKYSVSQSVIFYTAYP